MKFLTTLSMGIMLAIPLTASADDAKKQLEKLQGAWTSVSYEIGGIAIEDDDLKAVVTTITIKGAAFEWKAEDGNDQGTLKIDATKDPKQIDFVSEQESGVKIPTWSGIYVVEGDTLKLCIGPGAGQRPKDFSTKNATQGVFTLNRSK
jgi:uncharacterized protein (TIGR03067 family)